MAPSASDASKRQVKRTPAHRTGLSQVRGDGLSVTLQELQARKGGLPAMLQELQNLVSQVQKPSGAAQFMFMNVGPYGYQMPCDCFALFMNIGP